MQNSMLVVFLAATLLTSAVSANAASETSKWMQPGPATTVPIGHYNFCKSHPLECLRQPDQASTTTVSAQDSLAMIDAVNREVNAAIKPVLDIKLYGQQEFWTYPTTAGDCEDFALLKRRKLIEKGLPAGALLLTTVKKADGEGHAVLTVHLDTGDFILDNLDNSVKLWTQTPYTFVKRQAAADPAQWLSLGETPIAVSAAVAK
ncbi:transglutaminase-like cysteine peptidase [Rhizobium sp. LjRoot30]|uniref:transglutaminase-like cysteine peptidase n=1 Tax=Rhizobium sp. LjRoot30 TaxID=3342320 RepID=UPI003ED060DE